MKAKNLLYSFLIIVFLAACSNGASIEPSPGKISTSTGIVTQKICDEMEYVSDVTIPDGTTINAGQEFVKTWKVKNTGICAWTTDYKVTYSYGEKMGGVDTPFSAEVQPNAEAEISVTLTAPSKPGTYSGYWTLASSHGFFFGPRLTVMIIVP